MAALAFIVLIMAMTVGHSSANWCICKNGISDTMLQKTLDYACGAGADCNPIHSNGACYNPNTVLAHCNYAVNSYYQNKRQASGSCEFAGAATVTASDPSSTGCTYPTSASSTSTGTVPVSTTPSTSTGTGTTPSSTTTSTNPYSTTNPNSGIIGGIGSGMGPAGTNMDDSAAGLKLTSTGYFFVSGLVMLILA